jgi:hypothetical protein
MRRRDHYGSLGRLVPVYFLSSGKAAWLDANSLGVTQPEW